MNNDCVKLVNRRDKSIDMLRFIGLSLIILAHVYPPYWLLNLRCFDVPMMILVSGLAYAGRKSDFSIGFLAHRFSRLVFPVWIFLSAYFILALMLKQFGGIDFGIRRHHVIGSFLLQDGIGYVWIIRVFLMIGIITPLLLALDHKVKSLSGILVIICSAILIVELCVRYAIGKDNMVLHDHLYYCLGYMVLFLLGLRIPRLTDRAGLVIIGGALVLMWIYAEFIMGGGNILRMNEFKYPPQAYYILYGIAASLGCYYLIRRIYADRRIAVCEFIGMNTIWIYLYHIPLVQFTGQLGLHWSVQYIIVYGLAVSCVWIQLKIIEQLQRRLNCSSTYLKYLKG